MPGRPLLPTARTVVLASSAIHAGDVEHYLRRRGCPVEVMPLTAVSAQACRGAHLILAAHEYEPAALARLCAECEDGWVHLVSSGTEYAGLPTLCTRNLVTRTWQAYARPLAEYVLAALLEVEWRHRHHWTPAYDASARRGLFGKSALVLGFGAVGRNVAAVLRSLGVDVSVIRRTQPVPVEPGVRFLALSQLAGTYDYVVGALPDNAGTRRLVDDRVFAHVKPGGHFVNVGRGATVDMNALRHAVDSRGLWATLDVTEPEPLPPEDPLRSRERVRLSGHVAWQTGLSALCFLDDWMTLRRSLGAQEPLPPECLVSNRLVPARSA